jgi:hypothetical protein
LEDDPTPRFNCAVLAIATIIKFVIALAAEAEFVALFMLPANRFPTGKPSDLGWLQPQSPIQIDNSTTVEVTNKTIVPRKIQNDGHEAMVVKMLRLTKSILILLGCRLEKLG